MNTTKGKKAQIFFAGWLGALLLVVGYNIVFADTVYLNQAQDRAATRACSHDGIHAQKVTTSSTSAFTTNATGVGKVRLVCSADAHFFQGAVGVTGPTASTGDSYLAAGTPEYLYSPGSRFAFIQDSAGGTCFVTDCH